MSIRATNQKPTLQVTDFCVSVGHESEQRYVLSLNITAVNEQQRGRMALDFVRHGVEYAVNVEEQSTLTGSHDDHHQRTTTLVLLLLFY